MSQTRNRYIPQFYFNRTNEKLACRKFQWNRTVETQGTATSEEEGHLERGASTFISVSSSVRIDT